MPLSLVASTVPLRFSVPFLRLVAMVIPKRRGGADVSRDGRGPIPAPSCPRPCVESCSRSRPRTARRSRSRPNPARRLCACRSHRRSRPVLLSTRMPSSQPPPLDPPLAQLALAVDGGAPDGHVLLARGALRILSARRDRMFTLDVLKP